MIFNSKNQQTKTRHSVIVRTLMTMAVIGLITACTPTPTAEENAAQTKVVVDQAVAEAKKEMIAEKEQQDAAAVAKIEEKNNQNAAVAHAVANERKKIAAEQRAANAKNERRVANAQNERRASTTISNDDSSNSTQRSASACRNCGVVQSVDEVEVEGSGSGLGVIAGGVAGGVLGHQVGGGTGRDLATIAGVVGGAYAGNKIEKNVKKVKSYNIVVKMNSGEERTFSQTSAPDMARGDRVKIENDVVVRF